MAGVILAGGLSRRMGGAEKSLLKICGKNQISWVADNFEKQVQPVSINANGEPDRFSFLDLPVIADTVDGFVGPLAGVLAGMRWANDLDGITHIITSAADTPFFPDSYVERLRSRATEGETVVMAKNVGRVHPVFGLWPVHIADDLERFLIDENKRKILEFADRYRLVIEDFDDVEGDPFFNVNTPEDLKIAEEMMGQRI